MATAIGGGTVRDVLLDRNPIFWIADPTYLVVILATTGCTLFLARLRLPSTRALLLADALGLAFFTIGGVQIAEQSGVSALLAIVMGTITGVAGGVVRDVLCAEIPLILRRGHLYASAAIIGAALYLILERTGTPRDAASLVGMVAIAAVRLVAIMWKVELPVLSLDHHGDQPPAQ